ncbi:MAG: tRNA (adenosine(37)-N6)-dimethylallyltransferase MiaA [bacterium]|nr:tRNA (adenosine(37)-N6)-dimethylallyltransferase MiaA [bacterium]
MRKIERKVLAIIGPTAVGKSALAVALARKFGGEIISADSRQVYKGLDIGTGKITKKEMGGVPHHLLDIANPRRQFSVSEYQKAARQSLKDIFSRGKIPIVVGGTGLYVQAIVNDVSFPEVPPNGILRKKLENKTVTGLFKMLKKLDSRRAKTIDPNNPRRLVRAIEIATALGKVPPYQNSPRRDIEPLFIGLALPNEELKKRIALRLRERIRKGMLSEVKRLHAGGLSWERMEALGLEYRYISRYLRGLLSNEEMTLKLQSEIFQYAKRQMVWFKRDTRITWFKPNERRSIERTVREFLSS